VRTRGKGSESADTREKNGKGDKQCGRKKDRVREKEGEEKEREKKRESGEDQNTTGEEEILYFTGVEYYIYIYIRVCVCVYIYKDELYAREPSLRSNDSTIYNDKLLIISSLIVLHMPLYA